MHVKGTQELGHRVCEYCVRWNLGVLWLPPVPALTTGREGGHSPLSNIQLRGVSSLQRRAYHDEGIKRVKDHCKPQAVTRKTQFALAEAPDVGIVPPQAST